MRLSTKGRYGLKAMYELAIFHEQNTPMPIKTIAQKTGLSDQYLEQIFSALKKAKLITSVRGAQGGYFLAKKPEEISVGDVIRCLDGPIEPAVCVSEDENHSCEANDCGTRFVWRKLKDSIDECLDSISLQDMIENKFS